MNRSPGSCGPGRSLVGALVLACAALPGVGAAEPPTPAGSTADGQGIAERFVQRSQRNPRWLALDDGRTYVPIGFNLIPTPPEADWDATLDRMASYRITYCRIWLDLAPFAPRRETGDAVGDELDDARVATLGRFLDAAGRRGIKVKVCLDQARTIAASATPGQGWSTWTRLHTSHGGGFASMRDYLATPEGRARHLRKLDLLAAHLGRHPAVFAWELWNEMDCVQGDWQVWTADMLGEFHRRFPRHLVVQSLGSFDAEARREAYRWLAGQAGNDVLQVHRYHDLAAALPICHGPIDAMLHDAVGELIALAPRSPLVVAESGGVEPAHAGPWRLYAMDPDGTVLHDVVFAPFFSGACAPGNTWWWRESLRTHGQRRQYARFAEAIAGIDPAAEDLRPELIEMPPLRAYVLRGAGTTLAWLRDQECDWRRELEQGAAPSMRDGMAISLPGPTAARIRVFDPWTGLWTDAGADPQRIVLPAFTRSLVVRIDRAPAPQAH